MAWPSCLQTGPSGYPQQKNPEYAAAADVASCSYSCTTVTLYHQTSPENARKILSTGLMKPGVTGYGGAGIYFAPEIGATCCKATKKGVILQCQVDLGRVREIRQQGDWSSRFWRRLYGYDSIKITGLDDGVEHVIFEPARVKHVQLWRPGVEAAEMAAAVLAQHCTWLVESALLTVLQALHGCCNSIIQQHSQQQQQQQYVNSGSGLCPNSAIIKQPCS